MYVHQRISFKRCMQDSKSNDLCINIILKFKRFYFERKKLLKTSKYLVNYLKHGFSYPCGLVGYLLADLETIRQCGLVGRRRTEDPSIGGSNPPIGIIF